ncbi:MAG: NAD-dependent epimerase [Myxococcales bacterium]|nr:MAG: NAD-dependent epimerase [Myxococcales bacterium]
MQRVLVTGAAGFIGSHVSERLLGMARQVVGLDNLNAYYDPSLKQARLDRLLGREGFQFQHVDLIDAAALDDLFARHRFDAVVHLAAQAGVRYSIDNPAAYIQANLVGFSHVLESCRRHSIQHLVYASSSSVYGANTRVPFSVHDNVDHPMSLYAATKKSNELMAHSYANLFKLPVSGLRFFTVYGPWGRPDMALFLFARAILEGRPIDVFNHGKMRRDFTYIDDIVEGIVRVLDRPATPDPSWNGDAPDPSRSFAPYRLYNIGNNQPVELLELIGHLEDALGQKAEKRFLDLQPGDVPSTYADIEDLATTVDFRPRVGVAEGVRRFVAWYRDYHKLPA